MTGEDRPRSVTVGSWILLAVALLVSTTNVVISDFRENVIQGDQAAYLFQVVSLSDPDGIDLSFDERDLERWRDVDWKVYPNGLFFQETSDGYAFAKPYGYSLYASTFARVFGTVRGVTLANATLLVALVAISVAILRLRYRGPTVPLLTLAFCFASYAYMYAYVIQEDLFLAVLTGAVFLSALWWWRTGRWWLAAFTFALMAFGVSDKMILLALFAPLAVAMIVRERRTVIRAGLPVLGLVVFAVSVVPYVHYSEGRSWHPYGGVRYHSNGLVPFDGGYAEALGLEGWRRVRSDETVSVTNAAESLTEAPDQVAQSGFYYLFGRYTGMLVFIPVALFLLAAALARIRQLDVLGWVVLAGIGLYISTYLVLFTDNYYGTGSFGNRYFLQIAPSVLALAVAARITERAALVSAIAGTALGVVLLWPNHRSPSYSFARLNRTSAPQRVLPIEVNQRHVRFFTRGSDGLRVRMRPGILGVRGAVGGTSDPLL